MGRCQSVTLAGDEVALFIYRSNMLGADLRLTNYGGGNTSVKAQGCGSINRSGNGHNVD
jgi:rhamnose utilization protein RhaD (predicted bifunctional aldolase and dehydrogenase)